MKTIILILLFSASIFAQSSLLTLFDSGTGLAPYPVTADLVASYDENEMTVSSWADQTGTLDYTQSTADNRPTLLSDGINGYPALLFDGSNDFMVTPSLTLAQPSTVYLVFKNITWTNGLVVFIAADFAPALNLGGGVDHIYTTTDNSNYLIGTSNTNQYQILSIVYNGASSVIQTNESVVTNPAGSVGFGNAITLCALSNGTAASNCEFASMYIHSTAHDLTTRTEIIEYLNSKYGVY